MRPTATEAIRSCQGKLDGMWKLDGSYMLDAEMTPVGTRIGYRYESLYELHEAGLAVMAYNYACRMVESAILKAAYSFRIHHPGGCTEVYPICGND